MNADPASLLRERRGNAVEKIIVFGIGPFAELCHYYLTYDSPNEVIAFTVDREYMQKDKLFGLPVVPFEDVENIFAPSEYKMAVSISFQRFNRLREERYFQAIEKGYDLISYISSRASTWPQLVIGRNSSVGEFSSIQPLARIGNNVIVTSSVTVGHHAVVEDHSFVAPGAVILGGAMIEPHCVIGTGAIIKEGVTVARDCVVGAGVLITKNTKPGGIYISLPPKVHYLRERNNVNNRPASSEITQASTTPAGVEMEDRDATRPNYPGLSCSVTCGLRGNRNSIYRCGSNDHGHKRNSRNTSITLLEPLNDPLKVTHD